eukprot:222189-Prymnesium_polylepis.2
MPGCVMGDRSSAPHRAGAPHVSILHRLHRSPQERARRLLPKAGRGVNAAPLQIARRRPRDVRARDGDGGAMRELEADKPKGVHVGAPRQEPTVPRCGALTLRLLLRQRALLPTHNGERPAAQHAEARAPVRKGHGDVD